MLPSKLAEIKYVLYVIPVSISFISSKYNIVLVLVFIDCNCLLGLEHNGEILQL